MTAVTIIAEAGVNHNGDMNLARQLIDVAAAAGVDYVKFQTFKANKLVTKSAAKADYQTQAIGADESQFEMIHRLELSHQDHNALIEHCQNAGVKFFSTAFDHESIQMLDDFALDFFKIPSGEITNVPYLRRIGQLNHPVILSTGMSTLAEVENAIEVLEAAGTPRKRLTVLHCNTQYPTPMEDVNLRAMETMRDAFKVNIGYSDHTRGIEIPIAAVAIGATVIEKHFTLDRTMPGPDHAASLEPDELKTMVASIRNIELAMGNGLKRPSASELPNREIARKSIVASREIRQGETLTKDNLAVKRPGTGVSPLHWDATIGRLAKRDFGEDELIEW
ncbi:N-acetylneuraminate synthase [Rhodopirellula baltica]|uniref:Sialic acid (N-acetykneuraminic acic) synthase n=1 Tax=Rhodopirellula baltica WH47 TaxID=991778 RepID=F2ALQ4_RHOBT|nr:N-acetylneuraminate synthase [Rhodopirellula baltica]EGF29400.1 sialic acid (N-acetykneuraminic acic) synthase [Rhodopirellula baltica WH47]